MKEKIVTILLVLALSCACVSSKKNKKNRQHFPIITCDVKAGRIVNPEFLVKCPSGCQDGKYRVYGTDIYASFSSICAAAIHSGTTDNSGGKILVRKIVGQSAYKGSYSNGVRSLSLPRWKESFIVTEGKGKRGLTYPTDLEYVEIPEQTQKEARSPPFTPITTSPEPTTPKPRTAIPTAPLTTTATTTITTATTTTTVARPPLVRARDTAASNIHPAYASVAVTSSRQAIPASQGRLQPDQVFRSPAVYSSSRQIARSNPGASRIQQILAEKAIQANPNVQIRDWQSRVNVPAVQRRPVAAERSNITPNILHTWSSDNRDIQGVRREWQTTSRVHVPAVQRRPTGPDTSHKSPHTGSTWAAEIYDTDVSNRRSSMSEFDKWVSGFSQSNSRKTDTETTWKSVVEVPVTKAKPEVKTDAAPDHWRGFSEVGIQTQEEVNSRPPVETMALGGINCKIDLVFLIDGSWSIGKRRFRIQKLFLSQMVDALDVGISGPLMGIVQYGDDPFTELSLQSYFSSKDLKNAIDKIPQKGGYSNVGKALSYVNKNYFSDTSGNRGGAPNVAVVLVDGWPTDKVEEASRLARESGINIFFVTIEGADDNEKSSVVEPNFVERAVCRTNGYFSMSVASWFGLHKIVTPLVKRMCDIDKLVCSKTCLNAADIGFVIDGSSSVGTGNFRTVLQFIANITNEFEISDTDTRIGAVQYTYEQRLEFGFDKYSTKQDVVNAIMRIGYWSGGTSTGAAITYATQQLFSKSKPNKRKIMIVITDGRSYDDVRVPAAAAHRDGVIAYAIGIAWAAQDELESIATDPDKDHSFFVDEFDSLYKFVGKIIQNICTEYNSQPRN